MNNNMFVKFTTVVKMTTLINPTIFVKMTTLVKKLHRSGSGSLTHDRKLAAGAAVQRRAGAQRVNAHARAARGPAASHSAERFVIFLTAGPKGALFN